MLPTVWRQLTTLGTNLERRVVALALRLRTRTHLIATLGAHELHGDTIGPCALMRTDYEPPQDGDILRRGAPNVTSR